MEDIDRNLIPVKDVIDALRNDTAETMKKYAEQPEEFCRDVLRMKPQEWQAEFMDAVSKARRGVNNDTIDDEPVLKMRFAIKSGTGVGKTAGVAALILWHLAVFPDSKIPCTAPTSPQIKAVLWPELRKWAQNVPKDLKPYFPYDVQTDTVKLLENMALARTARDENPEAFQGFHSKNIMLLADEASGVPDSIFLAGQGVMSSKGAITILIGNPTRPNGWFYDAFNSDSHLYWNRTINCTMSKMVQPAYVEEMRNKHGENSYEFRVRVMGEFHLEDSGFVIPRSFAVDATKREIESDTKYIIWGVDVSAGGKDKSAIAKRMGNKLIEPVKTYGGLNVMQFVDATLDEYYRAPIDQRPQEICIDVIGVGHGYVAQLKRELRQEIDAGDVLVRGINVAERRARQQRYVSLRVELWAKAREWFESQACKIPPQQEFINELCSVEWEVNANNGKWQLLNKRTAGKSPDMADAFILTFAGRKGQSLEQTRSKFKFADKNKMMYATGNASYLQGG